MMLNKRKNLDAYDSDCDELNSAKVSHGELSHLMGSDALAEVHNHDNTNNNVVNQAVQIEAMQEDLMIRTTLSMELFPDQQMFMKYGFDSCDPVGTPMVEKSNLDEDKEGKAVDPSHYRGMIGTLLYLTASRPDLQIV
ncbi:hypothetical protein Tco_0206704 [Tanacetum coccineum]